MDSKMDGTYINKGFNEDEDDIKKPYEMQDRSNTNSTIPIEDNTNEDENKDDRQTWGNSIEFLMSCIAMNVGLGNIWRFPFVAYENGGGAFLIPYILVLIFLGRPMYYLEMCLGQFSSRGNVKMFQSLAPILRGVGFGQLIGTICVATYYCCLIAISCFYLVQSFKSDLPWAECNERWKNTSFLQKYECVPSNQNVNTTNNNTMSSAELFFRIDVLKETTSIEDGIGAPDWELTICLAISWLMTFAVCAKGIQSSGKASYFLAIFPFVILLALLVRAVTLEGATDGILYFITPQWDQLKNANVWYNAVTQCFFSLNIGFGSVTMYASYNRFRHNVYRDAMVVTTLDTCTSLLSGTIIFGILGNLAFKMNQPVTSVVKSGGTGLAFISYPEAIARFESVPWLFSILFFLMLIILGIGSLVALQGCAFTVIMDEFPYLKIWHVSLGTGILGFIIGLVYITPGGQYIFTMVDFFGGTFIFFILNIVEIGSVIWWYGLSNICLDIEFMLKRRPGAYFRICWGLLVPIILIFVLFYFLITLDDLTYEGNSYPNYIIVWGWVLLGFGIIQPVLWFISGLIRNSREKSCGEAVRDMLEHKGWGPKDLNKFRSWQDFKLKMEQIHQLKNRNWFMDKLGLLVDR
ncbi:sodium-dependent nutrient amino acid transporter 1 isoform X2 [Aethina tumida]|uniref:sodium-dependent nutrient amino acid transporter 1 isoform X2 n=1 Tax=Aethina tumida TaxID=116153 RepID=UPI00096AF0FE|nr:sodium-dependent nutrient amino acid transporter 1 isoform X2 [Aethina tumida]